MARMVRIAAFTFALLGVASFGTANAGALPGDLLVTDFSAFGGSGGVIIVDPGTGNQTTLSNGGLFADPWDICVDGSGRIFVSDIVADAIIEVNAGTGVQSLVTSGGFLSNPTGVEAGVGTDLWVCDSGSQSVVLVNKDTGFQTLIHAGPPLVSPFGVAVNKFGTVYVLDRLAGGGTVFEMIANVPVPVASGAPFVQPYGMTADQGAPYFPANEPGGMWVADRNAAGGTGAIILVDVNTGTKTVESSGQNFSEPSGVTISQQGFYSKFYACDYATARVVEFDPALAANANQSILSSGDKFSNPARIAIYPEQPVQNQESTWGRVKGLYR